MKEKTDAMKGGVPTRYKNTNCNWRIINWYSKEREVLTWHWLGIDSALIWHWLGIGSALQETHCKGQPLNTYAHKYVNNIEQTRRKID